jgi:hypothetical protein
LPSTSHCNESLCSWSPYTSNNNNEECGKETDDKFWYMGSTECFRANAAWSLYGILNGKDDVGCNRKTFINSFFTVSGVESFTQALYEAGVTFQSNGDNDYPGGATSQCSYQASNNNADDSASHNQKYGTGYSSSALGCYKNSFAMKVFKGPFCNSLDEVKISDKMSNFNNDLQLATCVPIYSATDGNDNNDLNILQYSSACSIREFPNSCPDPYGKLARYSRAQAKAVAKAAHPSRERLKDAFSWILLTLGVVLIIFSFNVCIRRARRSRRKGVLENGTRRNWFSKSTSFSSEKVDGSPAVDSSSSCRRILSGRRLFRCYGLKRTRT